MNHTPRFGTGLLKKFNPEKRECLAKLILDILDEFFRCYNNLHVLQFELPQGMLDYPGKNTVFFHYPVHPDQSVQAIKAL